MIYQHGNRNHETHAPLPSPFGVGNLCLQAQLAASYRQGCVVSYCDAVLSQAITRMTQTHGPLRVVHRSKDRFWSAGDAHKPVATLRKASQAPGVNVSPNVYQILNVAGYGHLDCILGRRPRRLYFRYFRVFSRERGEHVTCARPAVTAGDDCWT